MNARKGEPVMIEWIIANGGSVVVSLILLCIVIAIVFKMVRDRRVGKSGCGCGCAGCGEASACHGEHGTK